MLKMLKIKTEKVDLMKPLFVGKQTADLKFHNQRKFYSLRKVYGK